MKKPIKLPFVVGGVNEKKSNGGTQYYQQDRVYMMADVAMCLPSQIPRGSYLYLVKEDNLILEEQHDSN